MSVNIPQSELDVLEKAFHLMWDKFPELVRLIYKDREVIAVNEVGAKFGLSEGNKCSEEGPPEAHRDCQANRAMSTQRAAFNTMKFGEKEVTIYWLPVDGYPDVFLHFAAGTATDGDA
ncbi:MAG: hypothetical protein LBK23_08415 [Oscillospiraceae bacterium]|jgi:hypothetical protein|nr:hypothetical protein [Oscillospiraceae bacterium]